MMIKSFIRIVVLVAMSATILFGAFGASSPSSVFAQDVSWQIYRIETSSDGTLYIEYRNQSDSQMLIREDGTRIYATGSIWAWSAISEMIADPAAGRLSFFSFRDLLLGTELVYPDSSVVGSFSVWEEPFANGSFLVFNCSELIWYHTQVEPTTLMPMGGGDVYPIEIIGNELGYMFGSTAFLYNALTRQSSPSPAWPLYHEDVVEVSGLGGQPGFVITHYQVIAQTSRWQFITGLVNDQLTAGLLYDDGLISYWLGSTIDPSIAYRLVTTRDNNLILVDVLDGEIDECQVAPYGVNCAALAFDPDESE